MEVPYSQLFKVEDGRPVLLDEGAFSIRCLQAAGEMAQVQAQVGSTAWLVQPGAQTLTAGQQTFVFSVSEAPAAPLTLVLAADTEPEAVGILEAILEELSVHRQEGGPQLSLCSKPGLRFMKSDHPSVRVQGVDGAAAGQQGAGGRGRAGSGNHVQACSCQARPHCVCEHRDWSHGAAAD